MQAAGRPGTGIRLSFISLTMLLTIAIILLILWALGLIGAYTIGWYIHILLVIAIILILIRVIRGENPF
jgi:hypothetical protein